MELLFVVTHWHSLAKLRMHNDLTLEVMDGVTSTTGEKLREFKDITCAAFITRELEREFNARARRQAKKETEKKKKILTAKRAQDLAANSVNTGERDQLGPQPSTGIPGVESEDTAPTAGVHDKSRRLKAFNINTYKIHALGDYTATIRRYGTTDSYSTEPVSNFRANVLHGTF
jgi:hypothetical protein